MWRSSGNLISRNAFDFCVRGYSHGIYNRGQDSAGILFFEQCHSNVFAENSCTHGGDGFFVFGGKEAIGETPFPEGETPDYTTMGCNNNVLVGNDLSSAPAHGIELTFSRDNVFLGNRIVGNAICGVWGGYSNSTVIAENEFTENGSGGYGLDRGGINIEHGSEIAISDNRFTRNACGVHLWWDDDAALLKLPGGDRDSGNGQRRGHAHRRGINARRLEHAGAHAESVGVQAREAAVFGQQHLPRTAASE